jgi:hypothetical protein
MLDSRIVSAAAADAIRVLVTTNYDRLFIFHVPKITRAGRIVIRCAVGLSTVLQVRRGKGLGFPHADSALAIEDDSNDDSDDGREQCHQRHEKSTNDPGVGTVNRIPT